MTGFVGVAVWLLVGIPAALAAILCIEVVLAVLFGRRHKRSTAVARQTPVGILVPAHNEALGIATTIRSIQAQLRADDRLVIVADNCTDDTAALARSLGAEVLERTHATQRGKGFALDFGVRHFEATSPPPVVIILDADCRIDDGCIDGLVESCGRTGRPAQACYLMEMPAGSSVGTGMRVAQLAWVVKNLVRPLGLRVLDLPCPLFGTGMAFPWAALSQAQLASGNIVEDMQLGVDLTVAGHGPVFVPSAVVRSDFPANDTGQTTQRTRWEHGHLLTLIHGVPRLLVQGLRRLNWRAVAMSVDLAIPPLALLVMLQLATLVPAALGGWLLGTVAPLLVALGGLASMTIAIGLAWAVYGRHVLSMSDLLAIPGYVIRKIGVYVKFVSARQTEWVRSQRDGETRR